MSGTEIIFFATVAEKCMRDSFSGQQLIVWPRDNYFMHYPGPHRPPKTGQENRDMTATPWHFFVRRQH